MIHARLAALLLLLPLPAQAQSVIWTMPTEYPATSMPGEGVRRFAEAVGRMSGGRIQVTASFDAALGIKSAGMVQAVQSGRVPAADAFAGALAPTHPLFLLSSLPFLATTIEESRQLYEIARPRYEAVLAGFGQKLLYVTPWPASGIWAKKPIRRPADLAGLKLRTYDESSTSVMRASGAAAVLLSFDDAMPKLKDGAVEAVLSSGDGGAGRRLWEHLPEFTEVGYAMPLSIATLGVAAWNGLSAELQAAVTRAAAETEAAQWALIRTRTEANYTRMRSNGVEISADVGPELKALLTRSAATAIDEWAARMGAEGPPLLTEILERLGKKS